jgi:hypothetical protein
MFQLVNKEIEIVNNNNNNKNNRYKINNKNKM